MSARDQAQRAAVEASTHAHADDKPLTVTEITDGIRATLTTITAHWARSANPPKTAPTTRGVPESRLPGNTEAIILRADITLDLAFWVHALLDQHPVACAPTITTRLPVPTLTFTTSWEPFDIPATLDCTDVPAMCAHLSKHAGVLAAWEPYGNRAWAELAAHARDIKRLASPPARDTMALGECDECGTVVRAKAHDPGNIRCPGCRTVDTIDGWIIRIVGNEPLVTAEQLIPILHKRMGVVATRVQIRKWKQRGVIHASGVDARGRTVFDRAAVFAALSTWEDKQSRAMA